MCVCARTARSAVWRVLARGIFYWPAKITRAVVKGG